MRSRVEKVHSPQCVEYSLSFSTFEIYNSYIKLQLQTSLSDCYLWLVTSQPFFFKGRTLLESFADIAPHTRWGRVVTLYLQVIVFHFSPDHSPLDLGVTNTDVYRALHLNDGIR